MTLAQSSALNLQSLKISSPGPFTQPLLGARIPGRGAKCPKSDWAMYLAFRCFSQIFGSSTRVIRCVFLLSCFLHLEEETIYNWTRTEKNWKHICKGSQKVSFVLSYHWWIVLFFWILPTILGGSLTKHWVIPVYWKNIPTRFQNSFTNRTSAYIQAASNIKKNNKQH